MAFDSAVHRPLAYLKTLLGKLVGDVLLAHPLVDVHITNFIDQPL
jgi:hypothetical protein